MFDEYNGCEAIFVWSPAEWAFEIIERFLSVGIVDGHLFSNALANNVDSHIYGLGLGKAIRLYYIIIMAQRI